MNISIDLLKVFLPDLLIDYFALVSYEEQQEALHLYFQEKKGIPKEFSSELVISHGFHKEITLQDFPIRGKQVYLHIKRRRWLHKQTKQILQRDWNLVAQGTRMTEEFAAFLKEISRYSSK